MYKTIGKFKLPDYVADIIENCSDVVIPKSRQELFSLVV